MKKSGWKITFIKFLSVFSLGFLSLVTCAVGTYSWFAANKVVGSNDMGIVLKNEEIIEDVIFHKAYSGDATILEGTYAFDLDEASDHDLGLYNLVGRHKQSLVEIRLKKALNVDIFGVTDAEFYLGDGQRDSAGELIHPLQLNNNSLTSIVEFYAFTGASVNVGSEYISLSKADSSSNRKSFVNDTYTDLIDAERLSIDSLDNVTSIFLMIDYDALSISTIYSANLGNDVLYNTTQTDSLGNPMIGYNIDFVFQVASRV